MEAGDRASILRAIIKGTTVKTVMEVLFQILAEVQAVRRELAQVRQLMTFSQSSERACIQCKARSGQSRGRCDAMAAGCNDGYVDRTDDERTAV